MAKKKDKQDKSEVNKAEYNIVLLEKLGGTVREITKYDAIRWRDEEDHVVYLKNEGKKFLEIFPQDMNDFKNYTEPEVDKLVLKHQTILEKERDRDTDNINDKDIEYELLKLKAKKRSFLFKENSAYLSFNAEGRPTFYFLREGSTFFPFKWDTDTKNIFVPSDNRKKSASIALRNKENKYNTAKLINGAGILLIIIGFLFAGGGAYFMYKSQGAYAQAIKDYEATEIAQSSRICLENAKEVSTFLTQSAKNIQEITTSLEDEINKPQTVINGVIPE
jgi:hypothetical protein